MTVNKMTEDQRKYLSSLMPSILLQTNDIQKERNTTVSQHQDRKTVGNYSVTNGRHNIKQIGTFDTTNEEAAFYVDLTNVMKTVSNRTQQDFGKMRNY